MAKATGQTAKRSGPPSLFKGKVIARRSAVFTSAGNVKIDALRARLARELGRAKPLSLGDVEEGLVHLFGEHMTGAMMQEIADQVNAKSGIDT